MPARPKTRAAVAAGGDLALDLVAFTIGEAALEVLLVRDPSRRDAWQLPAAHYQPSTPLADAAARFASFVLGSAPTWCEQVGAASEGQHPMQAAVSIGWVTAVPRGTAAAGEAAWHAVDALPASLASRHQVLVDAARAHVRQRLDHAAVAFHFLPPSFTLSGLQEVYERLLGRAVHKASFRRALAGAALVAPTEAWRSEGRGRPAQLFTLAPKPRARRGAARAIRFDFPID
jgi:8-oxo-dGTP diphosphatase